MVEDERFRWLMAKAQFVVDHLDVDWLTVGTAIEQQLERGANSRRSSLPRADRFVRAAPGEGITALPVLA